MKRMRELLSFELILCILILIAYYMVNELVYANTLRNWVALIVLVNIVVAIVFHMVKNRRKEVTIRPWEHWVIYLLIAVSIVLFVLAKPNYTYEQGRDIVVVQGYEDLHELPVKSIWAAHHFKSDSLKLNAYLYAGEMDDVEYYILVSVFDGEIATEKVGDGNYIDRLFEMKYGPQ